MSRKLSFLCAVVFVLLAAAPVFSAVPTALPVFEQGRHGPYANFLYTGTPDIAQVRQTPRLPRAGQPVRISALVKENSEAAGMPVKRVTISWSQNGAPWTTVDMLKDDDDPELYLAYLPAADAGAKITYYVSAYDVSGGLSSEMPGYATGFPTETTNMISVTDEDAPDSALLPDVDVLGLHFGYDEKYVYVKAELQGKPGKGNMAGQGAYLYLIPVLNLDKAKGIDDFMSVDLLAYAPMLGQMIGIGEYGLFRIAEIMSTKKSVEGADVKLKKDENSLNFRFNREVLGDMPSNKMEIGMLTVAAKSFDGLYPQEAAPFITAYMRNHQYTVAPAGNVEPVAIQAGVSEVEITPPVGTPLAGYGDRQGKPSTGVHDPLLAQALVIQAGDEKMVFITADFFLLRRQFFKDLARIVEEQLGIPRERVIASGSHSHCTSGGMFPELALLGGKVSPGLYEATLDKFVDAVKKADAALQPARLGFGTGDATGYASNRVTQGGPVDKGIRVMRVDKADGKPLAVLFNMSAHPTTMGGGTLEFSADFVGPARQAIKDAFPGAIAMYANGTQGNQSPSCPGECGNGFDRVEQAGRGLGAIAVNTTKQIKTSDKMPVEFLTQDIIIQPDYDIRITMDGIRFGDTAMLTIPGEMFVELADPVKKLAADKGIKNLFLLGLTNDGMGYIVTREAYDNREYESTFALFGPGEGEFIQQQLLAMLGML